MSHIPNPIDDLFIPELNKKIEPLTIEAKLDEVIEMCNDLVDVLNHINEIISGGGEVDDEINNKRS